MKKQYVLFFGAAVILAGVCAACNPENKGEPSRIRSVVDTVGFAHRASQMDSVMARIIRYQQPLLQQAEDRAQITAQTTWKLVISPHDDYTYAGYLYPAALRNVRAKTLILFGVAHKARTLGLQDQIIFDGFDAWQGPYGPIKVSSLREQLTGLLPDSLYQINDTMQAMEHSLEALLPFLQYYHRNIEIVPVLVPYMSYERMERIAPLLAGAINRLAREKGWRWGKDFALIISNDAVHYGDRDWGGKNFARYGADSSGYGKALQHEEEIIRTCLTGSPAAPKVKLFTEYTVQKDDYKQYKWTWCGRYALPFGLLTAYYLQKEQNTEIKGRLIGYGTSIAQKPLPVRDLGMGITAPANIRHWVGYVAVGYE